MLNPIILQHAQNLTRELAELRELGYDGKDLDSATVHASYRHMARLRTPQDATEFEEPETIPTDQIAGPARE